MKHFEFWHPRLFELPYYLFLLGAATFRGLSVKSLARANFALDHGEIGIGSKFQTQMAFNQQRFLPTVSLPEEMPEEVRLAQLEKFAADYGYPLILKSDIGSVGKGVVKVASADELPSRIAQLRGPYIAQQFTANNFEYGVFYVRHAGQPRITGINRKHFPAVTGDGQHTLGELARAHPRFSAHWQTFMQYLDQDNVPDAGEEIQLSFIGSHTMGCKFTDDSHLLTPALETAVFDCFADQPGFNFGRLDVKATSEAAFLAGDFVIIEVNGVASLPTHMFDPDKSLLQAYRIFLAHGWYLVQSAADNRHRAMPLASYREIVARVRDNMAKLNQSHQQLMRSDN